MAPNVFSISSNFGDRSFKEDLFQGKETYCTAVKETILLSSHGSTIRNFWLSKDDDASWA